MHQFKINGKMAFEGDVWQWHQDYGTWMNDDMMPTERAMNVAIFLDDVNEFNGPLMFIPGSHKKGVIDAKHDLTTTSYPLWTVDDALIAQLVERSGGKQGGIVSPTGPAGSMILFHSCLVHASGSNLSPWNRVSVYLSLCASATTCGASSGRSTSRTATSRRSSASPTTACSRRTCRSTCPGRAACRPVRSSPRPNRSPPSRKRHDMSLHAETPAARRRRPPDPHRPDRRRQVRLDVPRAGAAHARRAPGRHRRPVADRGARQPRPRRLGRRANPGHLARRRGEDRRHSHRRRLAGAGAPPGGRRDRRMHRASDRGGRPLPRSVRAEEACRQRHGRGRCVLRRAAGAARAGGGRRVLARVRRSAGVDLRPGRLGAHLRLPGRRGRARPQVAAALQHLDARNRVGLLRPHARAGKNAAG